MSDNKGKTEAELIRIRTEKVEKLKSKKINPYPAKGEKEYSHARIKEIHSEFIASNQTISTCGRIMAQRGHGKLIFIDLLDETDKLQVILKADELNKEFDIVKLLDIGDFIEVKGTMTITKTGEVSLVAKKLKVLTKSIRPLPSKTHGIKDEETRYRKRYLDLLMNKEVREIFIKKAKFWATIRNFLIEKSFLEVHTPVLETTTGGADASPFETHHNSLDIDVYLRISCGELWQKRLLVGGFEKVFEIGRIFRNEGISREHLQDYSQMEFYWAYADYNDGMAMTEKLYKKISADVFGTMKFEINGHNVDFGKKWKKYDYGKLILKKTGIDIEKTTLAKIEKKLHELKVKYDKKGFNLTRAVDNLWKHTRADISGPGFLIGVPDYMETLAKRDPKRPSVVERFQIMIAGSELGKGFSELNDPQDQKKRFEEQEKLRVEGDEEAQMNDNDFVEALEYGMPPAFGFGLSERLFSFLMNKSIRECTLFPLVRPMDGTDKRKN